MRLTNWTRVVRDGLLLSGLTALTGACFLWNGSPMEGANPMQQRRPTSVGVVVQNQHWSDMVVYAVSSGRGRRLGMVTTTNRQSFEVSGTLLGGGLYLRAEVVGSSRSIRTDVLNVGEGDVVVWTLTNQLGLSHYEIR